MNKMDKLHLLKDNLNEKKEKKWDNRFITLKISEYDAYKDVNYLSLRLLKEKLKNEKNEQKKLKRAYSIRDSSLNNNKKIKLTNPNNDLLTKQNLEVNSKLAQKHFHNIKFNNTIFTIPKKNYTNTMPNSTRREKSDNNKQINKYSPREKKEKYLMNTKNIYTSLHRNNNYDFKENKNLKNIFINDIVQKIQGDKELNEI